MKKIILPLFIILFSTGLQAQQTGDRSLKSMTDPELGRYYLQKSRSQKTAGWILLGGGLALYTAGVASFSNSIWSESTGGAEVMILVGSLSTIACIPLFITAAKNKGRAEILLRHENVPLGMLPGKRLSLGITVPLGR
jgi:hypothetical protein